MPPFACSRINKAVTGGFPHSDIPGSKGALASPGLIAECHVLHRLLPPRHPPNALIALDPIQKKTGPFAWALARPTHPLGFPARKSVDPRAPGSRLRARRQRRQRSSGDQRRLSVSVFLTWKDCPCASWRQSLEGEPSANSGDGPAGPPLGTDARTSRVFAL